MSCTRAIVPIDPPVALSESALHDGSAVERADRWWTVFEDEHLDELIAEAMQSNFTLRLAWDRIEQARAVAAVSGAGLWPSIDASGEAGSTRTKTAGSSARSDAGYSLGVVAGYELDVWGRIRSARNAASLDVAATTEDLHSAAITLSAQIATTYFSLVEQSGQLALLGQQLQTNRDHLGVITSRFEHGKATATDVLQQQQLVESVNGDAALVEARLDVLTHQLAVLLGRTPSPLQRPAVAADLPQLDPVPAVGLPADLLGRRPDVRSAMIAVQAADQRVAAAIADQFPRLSVTARASTSSEQVRDLFDNWVAALAANVLAPVFDGGRRRAEVQRTRAVVSQRVNSYGRTVLTSLQEVQDALSQERKQTDYVGSLLKQLDLSAKATAQTLAQYTKGTTDFLRYLTTLLSHQRLQRRVLTARYDLVTYRINLYRALAGSWEMHAPPQARPNQAPADRTR